MESKTESKFVRLNSRVLPVHLKFIKSEAVRQSKLKDRKVTEGEVNRIIIDFYRKNHK